MRHGSFTALADAVAQFQSEIQRLAFAAVRAVIEQEFEHETSRRGCSTCATTPALQIALADGAGAACWHQDAVARSRT